MKTVPSVRLGERSPVVWRAVSQPLLFLAPLVLLAAACPSKPDAPHDVDGGGRGAPPDAAAPDGSAVAGASGGASVSGASPNGGAAGIEPSQVGNGGNGGNAGDAGELGTTNHCPRTPASPCFVPCGGDPTGVWRLEDACFSTTTHVSNCDIVAEGTPGNNDILLAVQPDGTTSISGTEDWAIRAQLSAECRGLPSPELCATANFNSDALLFSYPRAMACAPNACGACECQDPSVHAAIESPTSQRTPGQGTSVQEGNLLRLGFFRTPYCAQGDVLWIGGASVDGAPKVSYKLRKRSCRGTPMPCASRTADTCPIDGSCYVGLCRGRLAANDGRCGAFDQGSCGGQPGCLWDSITCNGVPQKICDLHLCDTQPGCAWGDPVEVCGGNSACQTLAVADCTGPGCSVHPCMNLGVDAVDCRAIANAADCARAPGCVPHPRAAIACTGQTLCSAQTDSTLCATLSCLPQPYCDGTATTDCPDLSLAACTTIPGCHPQW